MKKRPINKILEAVVERKPELVNSTPYTIIMTTLNKDNKDISYVEKLEVKENLRVLCAVCGLSYERMVKKVCQ